MPRVSKARVTEKALVDVRRCARCGGTHLQLCFLPFVWGIPREDTDPTHWASCPNTSQPIIMWVTDAD